MREELHKYLEKYFDFWKNERGTLPMVPFDEDCETEMYIGEIDEDEYIQWNYKERNEKIQFEKIEKQFDIILDSNLKEYYNSYYFLQLEGFINNRMIWFEPITEESDILSELEYVLKNEGKELIQVGSDGKTDLPLYIDNNNGNIILYDSEKNTKEIIADSLKDLFNKLTPKRN